MPTLSPQDITNILIAGVGVLFYVYKQFVEPNLPHNKAVQVNNNLAGLTKAATLVVQKIEQESADLSPAQRKSQAVEDVKALLREVGAPIPSDEAINGAIESAVYLLKLAQGKLASTLSGTLLRQESRHEF